MSDRLQLSGAMTALITPFTADASAVDYDTFGKLIERQIEGGIQGLVPCGTTGESPTLSHEEHGRVIEFTVEQAAGRVPVIAGTGSNCTAEAVRLTGHAKDAGADACLIVNPYYNKPPQRGMFEHIQAIAEVGLPIVLYNIPGRSSIEMSAETIACMYEAIPMVCAVKEATGRVEMAKAIGELCDITVISGDDGLTLPIAKVGGKGVISVLSNLMPSDIRTLTDLIGEANWDGADAQHEKLLPLFKGIFVETNPIPIKAAMAMVGLCEDSLRLPLVPLDEEYRDELAILLRDAGIC